MTGSTALPSGIRQRKGKDIASTVQKVHDGRPVPPPVAPPSFTLSDVRRAIPAHCFEHSLFWSFFYLFRDFTMAAVLFYGATFLNNLPVALQIVAWPLYWFAQGVVLTGVWVLAHECGHRGFSKYAIVNDVVGWICHSALLVPYHSWQISHANHHANTCSMEHDEVFVPATRSAVGEMLNDSPIVAFAQIMGMLLFGW